MLWLKEAVGEREEMFARAGGEPKSAILLKGVRRLFPTLPPQQPTPQTRIAARDHTLTLVYVLCVCGNTSTTHRGTLCTAAKARLGRVWSGPLTDLKNRAIQRHRIETAARRVADSLGISTLVVG